MKKHASDMEVMATVVDADTIRYGGSTFKRERTCQMIECSWDNGSCTWGCKCSACGDKFEHTHGSTWAYCPNCGSRIERSA